MELRYAQQRVYFLTYVRHGGELSILLPGSRSSDDWHDHRCSLNTNANANADTHANANANTDADTNAHTNADTKFDADSIINTSTDSNDANANSNTEPDTNPAADTDTVANT